MQYSDCLVPFILLQARFMKLMNEKASLIERIQELEHVTVQLSHETETIGEYLRRIIIISVCVMNEHFSLGCKC